MHPRSATTTSTSLIEMRWFADARRGWRRINSRSTSISTECRTELRPSGLALRDRLRKRARHLAPALAADGFSTLDPDDFTDTDAIAAVTRITNANFGFVQRLFARISRVRLPRSWG